MTDWPMDKTTPLSLSFQTSHKTACRLKYDKHLLGTEPSHQRPSAFTHVISRSQRNTSFHSMAGPTPSSVSHSINDSMVSSPPVVSHNVAGLSSVNPNNCINLDLSRYDNIIPIFDKPSFLLGKYSTDSFYQLPRIKD